MRAANKKSCNANLAFFMFFNLLLVCFFKIIIYYAMKRNTKK